MLALTRTRLVVVVGNLLRGCPPQAAFTPCTVNRRCLTISTCSHQPRSARQKIYVQPETYHYEEGDDQFSPVEEEMSLSQMDKSTTVDNATKDIIENFNPVTAAATISKLKAGKKKDVSAVVDVISSKLLRNKQFDDAVELTKQLVEKGIVTILPHTYTRLLKQLCSRKKGSRGSGVAKPVLALVHFMYEHGYKTNASHQFQILCMAARLGDSRLAQTCFDELKSNYGYQIDVRDYGLLVEAYMKESRKKNDWDNQEIIIRYFNELLDKGHQLKDRQIKTFLMNSVFSDNFDETRDVIGKLRKESDVDKYCQYHDYMLLLHSHLLRGDLLAAREIARKSEYPQDGEQLIGLYAHSCKKKEGDAP